jgi:hypothetical protein
LEFFEKIFKISRHFSNQILENSTLKNAIVSRKVYSYNLLLLKLIFCHQLLI